MKLLIYSHAFAPQIGGVETITMAQARGLVERDDTGRIKITVVTETPRGEFRDELLPFAVVRRPGFLRLAQMIREADVIHLEGPVLLPMILGWILGKSWSIEHHGFQTICPNGQLVQQPGDIACPGHFMAGRHVECLKCRAEGGPISAARRWMLTFVRRGVAKKARHNVVPTDWLGEQLKLPHTETIHHGLPVPLNANARDDKLTPPTFFFLGRLVPTKGVGILVAAARRLREKGISFQIKIAGDGPERANIAAQVESAGLAEYVELLGKVSDERARLEMERATATVIPSLGGEVFGLVALQSMICGCAVVASDLGSLREVIGDGGLIFPVGNDCELASRLTELAQSPRLAAQLGRNAQARALQEFQEGRMLEEHCRLFQTMLKKIAARETRS